MKLAGGYGNSTDDDYNWSLMIPRESRKHLKGRKGGEAAVCRTNGWSLCL